MDRKYPTTQTVVQLERSLRLSNMTESRQPDVDLVITSELQNPINIPRKTVT